MNFLSRYTIVQGDYLCFSAFQFGESSSQIAIADNINSSVRADLANAEQVVKDFPIQLLVLPPDYLRATFRELMPTIPARFGGGPISLLTEGVQWTAIGVDPTKLSVQAITQSKSADAANALATHWPKLT